MIRLSFIFEFFIGLDMAGEIFTLIPTSLQAKDSGHLDLASLSIGIIMWIVKLLEDVII